MKDEATKLAGDALSLTVVGGTLLQMLPAFAALFSIIWSIIRIYETKTIQRWLGKDVD
jgi:hypothetical protein